MWVLEPVAAPQAGGAATASQAAAGALQPQQQQFLSCAGSVSVGRPLKKGSSVGKADILVFNEQSVSTIHAALDVGAGQNSGGGGDDDAAQAFVHGGLSITDGSKFGTHLTRAGSEQEARLPKDEATPLSEGDVLRFGSNARFAVQRLRLLLCASDACRAHHPELQAQADALNGELVTSCSSAAAAPAAAAAAPLEACYALALKQGQHLCPALLRALLQQEQWRLVTPGWLAAVAARKACTASLPPFAEFAPQQLLLPPLPGQEQAQVLEVAAWQRPAGTLLASFHLVFEAGCEADLVAAATSCGAQCVQLHGRAQPARLQEQQRAAAAAHRTAVFVSAHDFGSPEGSGEQHAPAALPAVTGLQLLHALATGRAAAIAGAAEQHTGQPHRHAKAVAEPGADEEADATEEEEEMEVDAAGSDEAAAAAAAAAAAPPAAAAPEQRQQESSVLASPSSLAEGGWHQHGRSRGTPSQPASEAPAAAAAAAPASGRRTGHKRGAAAGGDEAGAAAGGGAATPASKRRKTAAAGNSPGKAPLQLRQLLPAQPQPQGSEAPSQATGGGAGSAADGGALRPECVSMQLCLSANEQRMQQQQLTRAHATTAAALGQDAPAAANFKTFRPKQLLWELGLQQQESNCRQRHMQQQQLEPEIRLVAIDLNLQQPDDEARLRELRQVEERARVANALFLADVKATRAPAAPRGGAAGRATKKK